MVPTAAQDHRSLEESAQNDRSQSLEKTLSRITVSPTPTAILPTAPSSEASTAPTAPRGYLYVPPSQSVPLPVSAAHSAETPRLVPLVSVSARPILVAQPLRTDLSLIHSSHSSSSSSSLFSAADAFPPHHADPSSNSDSEGLSAAHSLSSSGEVAPSLSLADDDTALTHKRTYRRRVRVPHSQTLTHTYARARTVSVPCVIKSDLRRQYATMLVNAFNSPDPRLRVGFLQTFCVPHVMVLGQHAHAHTHTHSPADNALNLANSALLCFARNTKEPRTEPYLQHRHFLPHAPLEQYSPLVPLANQGKCFVGAAAIAADWSVLHSFFPDVVLSLSSPRIVTRACDDESYLICNFSVSFHCARHVDLEGAVLRAVNAAGHAVEAVEAYDPLREEERAVPGSTAMVIAPPRRVEARGVAFIHIDEMRRIQCVDMRYLVSM